MTDLADFLLARITEDEAEAPMALGPCDCEVEGFPLQHGIRCIERFMSECEAKRELVALADPYDFADDGGTGMSEHADKILRLLALPYADHPDYREEWRP